ncbi:MAG: hypothetical protein K8S56_08905 [Candidatus Cloacimonetes bacterium]|nr:hypothetical protein [Candidatus Cloacimonadota bacterium]
MFYVTVINAEKLQKKWKLAFSETGIMEEFLTGIRYADVALSPDDYSELRLDTEYNPIGLRVVYKDKEVGEITGYFDNNAHLVLEIELDDGSELLIPDVEPFVTSKDKTHCYVTCLDEFPRV